MVERFLDAVGARFRSLQPTDEEIRLRILAESYPGLTPDEISMIRNTVTKNVDVTAGFGHLIPHETVEKEETFCLTFLNWMGGAEGAQRYEWDELWKLFTFLRADEFQEEGQTFWDNFQEGQGGARNWYVNHWESLQADLIRNVLHVT